MSKPDYNYRTGGWTTRRGEEEGILLHIAPVNREKPGLKDETVFIDKTTALRLAHTALEAMCRFWDIEWEPKYLRRNLKDAIQNIGLEVKEPYREGCPFCQHVADSDVEMMQHLKEHEIHLIIVDEEAEG